MLSTINNGQPKWGSDGGGFNQNSGNIENPSPELYTRWLQFASMSPVSASMEQIINSASLGTLVQRRKK